MIKPIVAVAAMILAEEGKLVLADSVRPYLPEFANMKVCNAGKNADGTTMCMLAPAESPITLQDLLRHTSGIDYGETTTNSVIKQAYSDASQYDAGSSEYNQRRVLHRDELKVLPEAPLSSQPGTNWEYGISMELMDRVIEVASRQPLAQFLEQNISAPLRMPDAGFYVPLGKLSRLA